MSKEMTLELLEALKSYKGQLDKMSGEIDARFVDLENTSQEFDDNLQFAIEYIEGAVLELERAIKEVKL